MFTIFDELLVGGFIYIGTQTLELDFLWFVSADFNVKIFFYYCSARLIVGKEDLFSLAFYSLGFIFVVFRPTTESLIGVELSWAP